jgi:hypothetical protein
MGGQGFTGDLVAQRLRQDQRGDHWPFV